MEELIPDAAKSTIRELVSIAKQDPKAELEIKVLSGQIQTKEVADRIVKAIESMTDRGATHEHRATFSYMDNLRVHVLGPENIHKVCTTSSFRNVPLTVERKERYFSAPKGELGGVEDRKGMDDVLDIPELKLRFTLRQEEPLRRDFTGSPMDPKNHIRILHRKSWTTGDGLLRIDMSLVKSKKKTHKTFSDILKQTPSYELEVEVVDKTAAEKDIVASLFRHVQPLLAAFQQSPFLLRESDVQKYQMEFERIKVRFVNPVTMERRHIRADRPHNILSGYTVTVKADGERSFLYVASDKRVLRITRQGTITWTGLTATDKYIDDVIDGEYLADRNLFCVFDVYRFQKKDRMRLPLMTTDDDITKDPAKSRLGCAHLFLESVKKDFTAAFTTTPFRIEIKLFLAGDGAVMEKAIRTILDTQFEFPTDGLVFTPKSSSVAPLADRKGDTWLRVYKWKPPTQNSIDFLVRFTPTQSYDIVMARPVFKGTLYVSRGANSDILYPCETMTGEYKPPQLPPDLQLVASLQARAPTPFQPSAPKAPNAFEIFIPLNAKNVPIDQEGEKIEDNTIIECARDVEHGRWNVMRTRYDKTYKYRVLGLPEFGNDISVAENIWTNIHNPVTEEMIRNLVSSPPEDTFEDDLYYRDEQEMHDRGLKDVRSFHNKIKEALYESNIKAGDTLLELAMGRAGDLHKWRKTKPSKVVGIELSASNLESPKQGACVRYLNELKKSSKLPPALFIEADMTKPLLEQDNRYLKILSKQEAPSTPYLETFAGLTEFDVVSCQMAMHYACESEDTFRVFVGNLVTHGKGLFFGTCMDGQSVYSLLLGKQGHMFRSEQQVFCEFTKEYQDGEGWTEEFGKAIQVKLESFEKPQTEYLVPFGKVTEILRENGFDLVRTSLFGDDYAQQSTYTITGDHRTFSFLHRSFVFRRVEKPEQKEELTVEEVVAETEPKGDEEKKEPEQKKEAEEGKEEEKKEEEPKPKRKIVKVTKASQPLPEIVFFVDGNDFSSGFEAPMQIDNVTFPTVEHYMQWSKAKMFGDAETQAKILKTKSTKSVRTYGDKVKEYKEDEWNGARDNLMKIAIKAKFSQHPELRAKLLETGDKLLAEANPREKYWTIGTSQTTSKAKDPTKWPGKNRLGELLQELRNELKPATASSS